MSLHGQQHILEPAQHVRMDRLGLEYTSEGDRRFHCEQLIPVIDSLMLLGEQLRERRFMPGTQFALSADETRLLTLFEQAERMDACKEANGLERAFRLALQSTRMMMKRERMLAGA